MGKHEREFRRQENAPIPESDHHDPPLGTISCSRCNDTGECDSGATDPQGNWIKIECECRRPVDDQSNETE